MTKITSRPEDPTFVLRSPGPVVVYKGFLYTPEEFEKHKEAGTLWGDMIDDMKAKHAGTIFENPITLTKALAHAKESK